MKFDLTTTIITAIIGVMIAYIVTSNILGESGDVSIKTISNPVETTLTEPSPEVFNYRALNPTVETYVGNGCQEYDANGVCINELNNSLIFNYDIKDECENYDAVNGICLDNVEVEDDTEVEYDTEVENTNEVEYDTGVEDNTEGEDSGSSD